MSEIKKPLNETITIWMFLDGYYGVGYEGGRKAFLPTHEAMLGYLDLIGCPHPHLTRGSPRLRKVNASLAGYLNE